jgi:replicative DNA helicase
MQVEPISAEAFRTGEALEQLVLGLALISPEAAESVVRLQPECFQAVPCREVWSVICSMVRAGVPVEICGVVERLFGRRAFDTSDAAVFVAGLVEGCFSYEAVHIDLYCRKLQQAAERRRLGALGAWLAAAAETMQEPEELRSRVVSQLEAADVIGPDEFCSMAEAIELASAPQSRPISTGWRSLDKILSGGWRPGQLVAIAARPGNGKSVFVLQSAMAAARAGVPVLFISLEMRERELAVRALRAQSRERAAALPIVFNRGGCSRLGDIVTAARRHYRRGQCGLLVVDYLQLVSVPGGPEQRWALVGEVSRTLKLLAQELNVPVLAAVQASRAADGVSSIQLNHLRESGSIEQDSDIVLGLNHTETGDGGEERDIDCIKNRAGGRGKFPVVLVDGAKFTEELSGVEEWDGLRPSWDNGT